MKKQPQHPHLPRYICRQSSNGRFRNMRTGEWMSYKQLERYSSTEAKTHKKQEVKPSHEAIIEKRWDLRMKD